MASKKMGMYNKNGKRERRYSYEYEGSIDCM
jgi:hypothetical protein